MTLGKRIKKSRKQKKLTQKQLADKLEKDHTTISKWESDTYEPDAESLKRLAEVLETTTDFLTGHIDNPSSRTDKDQNQKKLSLDDLDMKENENLFFFNRDGMSDEDIEKVKDYIELLRLKAKQYNEKHDK